MTTVGYGDDHSGDTGMTTVGIQWGHSGYSSGYSGDTVGTVVATVETQWRLRDCIEDTVEVTGLH